MLKVATTSSFILTLAAASFITASAAADEVHPATTAEATQNAPALSGFESYTPTAVVPVNYNQSVNTPIYIEQIKEIRARAWDANLPFNGTPLQEAAANAGYDRESYINAVTWNNELEQEAIIRAAELHVNFDHTRPNGGSFNSIMLGDQTGRGENIAYNIPADQAVYGWTILDLPNSDMSEWDHLIEENQKGNYELCLWINKTSVHNAQFGEKFAGVIHRFSFPAQR